MSETPDNPWRQFVENVISGDNYFRASEYHELLAYIDELIVSHAAMTRERDEARADAAAWSRNALERVGELRTERDALRAELEALQPGIDHLRETCNALKRERDEDQGVIAVWRGRTQRAEDERDALRAEVERLRGALQGLDAAYCRAGDALTKAERHEDRLRLIAARAALTPAEVTKPVCGECHLQPGEKCDVCEATDPRPKPAEESQCVGPLRRGVNGVCTRSTCECEREGLGDRCIWLRPSDAEVTK
jgi:DNA repair exonuclease SbcCD ATPase subunit